MDRHGIATGVLSVSTPGVHLGNDTEARKWARDVNEYTADLVRADPGRFGLFATLTLPDVEGAIAEAEYALDTLHANGVILLASNAGRYLGDPGFAPLLAYLDHRQAIVFVHPGELPGDPVPGIPAFTADFLLDTTRTAISQSRRPDPAPVSDARSAHLVDGDACVPDQVAMRIAPMPGSSGRADAY